MTEALPSKPPPPKAGKSEKVFLELPGAFKVGLVSEEETEPQPSSHEHTSSQALTPVALIAAAILCGMFLMLGRRKRQAGGKP